MKLLTYILNASGFETLSDYLGTFAPFFNAIAVFSASVGIFGGFVETYLGISFILWLFIIAGAFFDLILGMYANVVYLKQELDLEKFFRGVFKILVVMVVIFLTNNFNQGIQQSKIEPEAVGVVFRAMTSTFHYTSVMIIGIYTLLGIAENGAKIDMPFCVSLVRILKLKIKKLENEVK